MYSGTTPSTKQVLPTSSRKSRWSSPPDWMPATPWTSRIPRADKRCVEPIVPRHARLPCRSDRSGWTFDFRLGHRARKNACRCGLCVASGVYLSWIISPCQRDTLRAVREGITRPPVNLRRSPQHEGTPRPNHDPFGPFVDPTAVQGRRTGPHHVAHDLSCGAIGAGGEGRNVTCRSSGGCGVRIANLVAELKHMNGRHNIAFGFLFYWPSLLPHATLHRTRRSWYSRTTTRGRTSKAAVGPTCTATSSPS